MHTPRDRKDTQTDVQTVTELSETEPGETERKTNTIMKGQIP